jgi:hypothetical protein
VQDETSGRDTLRPAHAITRDNLVEKLLFCFLGHQDLNLKDSKTRKAAKAKLIDALSTIFTAISEGQFPRENFLWISDEIIRTSFRSHKLNQWHEYIRNEKVDFQNKKSIQQRHVFSAISAVANSIYQENEEHQREKWIDEVRGILSLVPDTSRRGKYEDQRSTLRNIVTTIRSFEVAPKQPIAYQPDGNAVIKTKDKNYFMHPLDLNKVVPTISGRFFVYRKVFSLEVARAGREYIREYLLLETSSYGPRVRWTIRPSDSQPESGDSFLTGIVVCTENALWLFCNTNKQFRRLRVMSADLQEWQKPIQHPSGLLYCTGLLLSQRPNLNRQEPVCRRAVLIRETTDLFNVAMQKSEELTREQVEKVLPADLVAILDDPI